MLNSIIQNRYVQLAMALLIGCAIGAVMYPTKTITEKLDKEYQSKIETIKQEYSKTIQEQQYKLDMSEARHSKEISELNTKLVVLTQENRQLRQKAEETIVRVIHPDGTIEEKIFKKSESEEISQVTTQLTQEFNSKIQRIEDSWKRIHEEKVSKLNQEFNSKIKEKQDIIDKLKSESKTEINPKKLGIGGGYTTRNTMYIDTSYTIFGPFFIDGRVESRKNGEDKAGSIGLGITF